MEIYLMPNIATQNNSMDSMILASFFQVQISVWIME